MMNKARNGIIRLLYCPSKVDGPDGRCSIPQGIITHESLRGLVPRAGSIVRIHDHDLVI
jgi:hypothetical protein